MRRYHTYPPREATRELNVDDNDMRSNSRLKSYHRKLYSKGALCGSTELPLDYVGCGEKSIPGFFDEAV